MTERYWLDDLEITNDVAALEMTPPKRLWNSEVGLYDDRRIELRTHRPIPIAEASVLTAELGDKRRRIYFDVVGLRQGPGVLELTCKPFWRGDPTTVETTC